MFLRHTFRVCAPDTDARVRSEWPVGEFAEMGMAAGLSLFEHAVPRGRCQQVGDLEQVLTPTFPEE